MHEHERRNDDTIYKGSNMAMLVHNTQDYTLGILILSLYPLCFEYAMYVSRYKHVHV